MKTSAFQAAENTNRVEARTSHPAAPDLCIVCHTITLVCGLVVHYELNNVASVVTSPVLIPTISALRLTL